MNLSFHDKESFMEAAGSLRFNNPPSDPNSLQRMGSSDRMPVSAQDFEWNEDFRVINDLNTPWRVNSSSSMPPQEGSEDA